MGADAVGANLRALLARSETINASYLTATCEDLEFARLLLLDGFTPQKFVPLEPTEAEKKAEAERIVRMQWSRFDVQDQ